MFIGDRKFSNRENRRPRGGRELVRVLVLVGVLGILAAYQYGRTRNRDGDLPADTPVDVVARDSNSNSTVFSGVDDDPSSNPDPATWPGASIDLEVSELPGVVEPRSFTPDPEILEVVSEATYLRPDQTEDGIAEIFGERTPEERQAIGHLLHLQATGGAPLNDVEFPDVRPTSTDFASQAARYRGARKKMTLRVLDSHAELSLPEDHPSGVRTCYALYGFDSKSGMTHRILHATTNTGALPKKGTFVSVEADFLRLFTYFSKRDLISQMPQWVAYEVEILPPPSFEGNRSLFVVVGVIALVTVLALVVIARTGGGSSSTTSFKAARRAARKERRRSARSAVTAEVASAAGDPEGSSGREESDREEPDRDGDPPRKDSGDFA